MAQGRKIRVAVLYGGRSGEHEISLQSAASVIKNLDPSRFEVIPVGIDKQGRWHLNEGAVQMLQDSKKKALPAFRGTSEDGIEVILPANPDAATSRGLIPIGQGVGSPKTVDVIFPVMHGPLCEDGTVQGLLEMSDIPYVGCGVLASAVGMDKDVAKRLIKEAGLPIVPYVCVRKGSWSKQITQIKSQVKRELGYPVFVKPCNMGSSVGVHKVADEGALDAALKDSFKYDTKVLIEKGIPAREIELSVLENIQDGEPPLVSVVGEIAPTHEFYSYEAKYLDENGAALMIPAKITPEQFKEAQRIAGKVFETLECEGMTRVDLFLDKVTGEYYVNEVNTIPGFTQISMYPKLWEASGISYRELLSKLVDLALARHRRKSALSREYLPD